MIIELTTPKLGKVAVLTSTDDIYLTKFQRQPTGISVHKLPQDTIILLESNLITTVLVAYMIDLNENSTIKEIKDRLKYAKIERIKVTSIMNYLKPSKETSLAKV